MEELKELIEKLGLTLSIQRTSANPYMTMDNSRQMINYSYTIYRGEKALHGFFSTGIGWVEPKEKRRGFPSFGIGLYGVTQNDIARVKSLGVVFNPLTDRFETRYKKGISLFDNELLQTCFQVKEPKIEDVVSSLVVESDVMDYDFFEDYARDMGGNPDSISEQNSFFTARRQTKEFRALVGSEAFEEMRTLEI